jgi:propionate CoA-transferase
VIALRAALEQRLEPLSRKAPALIEHDNVLVLPDVLDACMDMVRYAASRHCLPVTRYTTSAFLRANLGEALLERNVAPQIFEIATNARKHVCLLAVADGAPPAGE